MSPGDPGPDEVELAELRGRLRGRWKAERRDQEREALHEHWTRRSLIDALRETMDRGHQVAIDFPSPPTLAGHIVRVGRDYAVLRSGRLAREYTVRLSAPSDAAEDHYTGPLFYVEILSGIRTDLPTKDKASLPTFQAVLQQCDFQQQEDPMLRFEIRTAFQSHPLTGTLMAHAGDHLYFRDRQAREFLVPIRTIAYISSYRERR